MRQISALAAMLLLGVAGCSKPAADQPAEKTEVPDKAGVTMDTETQERIGLKTETPVPAQWQPQAHATGIIADPLALMAAVGDYASARAAADASRRELERTQKLAEENNASAHTLEVAQASAAHDALALKTAQATFTAAWGNNIATRTDLVERAEQLCGDGNVLVKLSFPVGMIFTDFPSNATVTLLGDSTNTLPAIFLDDLGIDPASQSQTLLYRIAQTLPRSAAVTASVDIPGEPVSGLIIPASAVLRHEGLGWVYIQTATNQFVRAQIPLDRYKTNGWFVTDELSATNQVVVTGAQTLLSTELGISGSSGGGD
jgi:hypothetical protein